MTAWLKTVVARVCLDMLRARKSRHEVYPDTYIPDPIVRPEDGGDPEQEALLAESVGLALLVVLETLPPAERLAFVLHDTFGVPFDEIAPIVGRTPTATRQLASRARRRVQGATVDTDANSVQQRAVVDAFFAAARGGNFEALISVLDPDVVLRSDGGTARPGASAFVCGASAVAKRALMFSQPAALLRPVSVNGTVGVLVIARNQPFAIMAFTVKDGKVAAINVLADPQRIAQLDLSAFGG
jgi:RNA polymerase sigma-70 factor (ECF subfamily)